MKSLLGGGGGEWWWQTKFNVSPGPGLWSLVLGPFGPDLGPDLDLTWDLDLSLKIVQRQQRDTYSFIFQFNDLASVTIESRSLRAL